MSGVDSGQKRLVESIRELKAAPKTTVRLITKKEAARRLGVSLTELRLRVLSGELDTARVGRRELVLFY